MRLVFYLCISALVFCECRAFWLGFYDDDTEENTTESSEEDYFEDWVDRFSKCVLDFDSDETEKPSSEATSKKPSISFTTQSIKKTDTEATKPPVLEISTGNPLSTTSVTEKENVETTSDGKVVLTTTFPVTDKRKKKKSGEINKNGI